MPIAKTKTKTENKVDLKRKVSIRQYIDPEVFNMGMEKMNMSVWSGESGSGGHKEWLGYKEIGGKKIFLTGLDVNADEVKNLDEESKEQKIKEIESVVKHLEGIYGKGIINPDNAAFWESQYFEIKAPTLALDLESTQDLLLYYGIKGRGYNEVAPSYEYARTSVKIHKFYLHEDAEVADIKVEISKLRNKAKSILETLDTEDYEKLFKIAKMLLPIEKGYTRNIPKSQVYTDLNDYIDGDYSKNEIKAAPKRFIEIASRDRATLSIQAIVREALYQRFITKNSDQLFNNPQTQCTYGRNDSEIIAYLSNPINAEELTHINDRVEGYWK